MLQPTKKKKAFLDRLETMWALSPYALLIAALSVAGGAVLEKLAWPWRVGLFLVLFVPIVMLIRGVARVAREKAHRELSGSSNHEAPE